jgi:squalene cyclase
VPGTALADTVEWLRRPGRWEDAKDPAGVKNAALANIQFASALLEAGLPERKPLAEAARALVRLQERDGSWKVDAGGMAGAPATYGRALATHMARRVLLAAGMKEAASRATAWLRQARPENVVDAAGIAMALPDRRDAAGYLKRAQNRDGGWGETFDTAVAILGLHRAGEKEAVERGRAWLVKMQQAEGGWQETTRPAGGVSYAEHISTTGWALYALVETGTERK